jgi:hypothetical protein
MSQIDYISTKSETIYFKIITLLLTYYFGYNEEINYPLSEDELNIENLRARSIDIDNKISLENCIIIASKIIDNVDEEFDEFIEDLEVSESDFVFSLDVYNKLYYDMLDTTYENNISIKNIFLNFLNEHLEMVIKEEDYEVAAIIHNKIIQINS